jgi:polysaccharide biosynthesis/export protein
VLSNNVNNVLLMLKVLKWQLLIANIGICLIVMVSCTTPKQVVYFSNLPDAKKKDDTSSLFKAKEGFESPIQKNDQLWIAIGGSNSADLISINSGNGLTSGGAGALGGTNSILGYLVEADGKIQLPYIGKVQAEGLSRLQLEAKLTELFRDYTKNPIVNVRFLNYGFSVLGEVNKSGRYNMTNERITILEAISMAGDLTDLGKRENVLVIREQNGERNFARLNLLSKDIFTSPFFYLKTNDIVYVEPVKAKFISRTGVPQYLSIVAVGLSLILTIINLRK